MLSLLMAAAVLNSAADIPLGGVATDLPGQCRFFRLEGRDLTGQCRGHFALLLPSAAEVKDGRSSPTVSMDTGNPQTSLIVQFRDVQRLANGANFGIRSINGKPASGNCSMQALPPPTTTPNLMLSCSSLGGQPAHEQLALALGVFNATPEQMESWRTGFALARDLINPELSDARLAAAREAAARHTPPSAPGSIAPSTVATPTRESAAVSNDKRAIFGLLVGARLPQIPSCRDGQDMPATQPYCVERDNSGKDSLSNVFTTHAEAYRKAGASPVQIKVNSDVFDTSLLFSLPLLGPLPFMELWVSRDGTIQMLQTNTRLPAADAVTDLLTRKFGKPTGRDYTEWRNNQTGQLAGKTLNLHWNLSDLMIDFETQSTNNLFGTPDRMGAITIHAAEFARRVMAIEQESAPPPRRGM